MILGGIGAGLTQAPLFASAATLSAHRATTGSAVLNMARQVGSAVGVAVLVALMASQHPEQLSLFDRGWALQFGAAAAAAVVLLVQGVLRSEPARGTVTSEINAPTPAAVAAPAPAHREPERALAG
jgi:MFS family permease